MKRLKVTCWHCGDWLYERHDVVKDPVGNPLRIHKRCAKEVRKYFAALRVTAQPPVRPRRNWYEHE
jgi:hypothetical protein